MPLFLSARTGITGRHPQAGYLSYQGNVTVDGRSGRFDDVCGYGWTVLARPGALTALSDDSRTWAGEFGVRLFEVGEGGDVSDEDGTYATYFDELGADVAVVRPDHYLYDAGAAADLDRMLDELRSRLSGGLTVS